MSFDKIEVRVFSGPDSVQIGSNTEPDYVTINNGPKGDDGAAATVTVGTTTTSAAGTSASVTNSGTTSAAVFDFTIPRGATGSTGAAGPNSVTSATTSDGTAELSVDTITGDGSGLTGLVSAQITDASMGATDESVVNVLAKFGPYGELSATQFQTSFISVIPNGIINLASTNVGGVVTLNGELATDARSIAFPNASGTIALTSDITNSVTSDTTSDGTCDLHVKNLLAENANSSYIQASITSKSGAIGILSYGERIDGTTLASIYFQRSSTAELEIHCDNLTATRAQQVANANGTLALTASTTGVPDKLTDGTIAGTLAINSTSYTYGTGAAVAHSSALGVVDSRVASLFTSPFHFQQDNYLGRWLTASGNNAFNWIGVGSASNWSDAPFYAAGFVGGVNLVTNNNAFFYYMTAAAAASISNFNGVVFDHVFSTVNTSIANENIFVGIRNIASATVETGRRGLWYEAGVDTNWQLLHETSAGVQTKIDTGKPVALNQIVRVTLKFVSTTQTDMIIATSTSTTPVTSSATTGFSCTGTVGLGFGLRSTTAANRFILPMRSILAWTPSTL
jgi:hypothetical protein